MFSLGPTRLFLWIAGSLPPCGLLQGFFLFFSLIFFFFFFQLCFAFPGFESSDGLVPWTPDAIANHICPDQGGGPSSYPTGLNFGNLLSEWRERERIAFQIEGNYVTGIWLYEEAESQNRKEIFRSVLIQCGLQKTFRTDGQESNLHVISSCLSSRDSEIIVLKTVFIRNICLLPKIGKMLKSKMKKIKITYNPTTQI